MKIKICGLTKVSEAEYLNENNVDYAGFVFYNPSKRNVSVDEVKSIMSALDSSIKKVAVTVSPDIDLIEKLCELDFDILQIHKKLKPEVIAAASIPIWYAMNIEDEEEYNNKLIELNNLPLELNEKIKGIVVDAPQFGSGRPFNWRKSKRLKKAGSQSPPIFEREFILAGGLNAENVAEGIEIFSPDVVDVSSSVEGANGKDRDLIKQFVSAVRNS